MAATEGDRSVTVILCSACGHQNRIVDLGRDRARCGHCQTWLLAPVPAEDAASLPPIDAEVDAEVVVSAPSPRDAPGSPPGARPSIGVPSVVAGTRIEKVGKIRVHWKLPRTLPISSPRLEDLEPEPPSPPPRFIKPVSGLWRIWRSFVQLWVWAFKVEDGGRALVRLNSGIFVDDFLRQHRPETYGGLFAVGQMRRIVPKQTVLRYSIVLVVVRRQGLVSVAIPKWSVGKIIRMKIPDIFEYLKDRVGDRLVPFALTPVILKAVSGGSLVVTFLSYLAIEMVLVRVPGAILALLPETSGLRKAWIGFREGVAAHKLERWGAEVDRLLDAGHQSPATFLIPWVDVVEATMREVQGGLLGYRAQWQLTRIASDASLETYSVMVPLDLAGYPELGFADLRFGEELAAMSGGDGPTAGLERMTDVLPAYRSIAGMDQVSAARQPL